MSTFDEASLVFIPSGYKTSKAYSVKPSDGSGDLAFTRSNDTATRVGPDGLIEKVRTNVVLQSEGFNTASWAAANTTITANAGVAPNGTTTADKIVPTTTGTSRWVEQARSITSSIPYTNSFYIKADGFSWVNVFHIDGNLGAYFNISNGTIGTVSYGVSASIVSVGSGWYRCIVTKTSGGSTGYTVVQLVDADGSTTATASGTNGVLVWGAQIETGDIATDYIATTSAAVSVGPVANVPRLDYLNSSCPRLLLEPQRQNVMTFSESIDNAAWTKRNATIMANAVVSPDGYTNADKLAEDSSTSIHDFYQYFLATSGVSYTMSFFAKAAERTFCAATFSSTGLPAGNVFFNLQTGVVVSTPAGIAASIVPYGNGWYRCIITATATSTQAAYFVYANALNGTTNSYAGTTGSGTYIWGAQLEAGAYATSYIPTLGAAVTRGADASYKASVSGLIGQTEGTLYAEVQNNSIGSTSGSDNVVLSIEGATNNDIVSILYQPAGDIIVLVIVGGSLQALITYNAGLTTSPKKIAVAYKNNDYALYVDGVLRGTDTSASVPTCSNIGLGNYYNGGSIQTINSKIVSQALLFPTRLSNSDLAALTA